MMGSYKPVYSAIVRLHLELWAWQHQQTEVNLEKSCQDDEGNENPNL